ncbi:MAG: C40 family peptidase [Prolixibacteraceae bacterium]|nr:C40 family peptidase [Prolixibacteraceae bacterium]
MNYGISALSLIPVRKEPSEKSEMVSQVLFGESFRIVNYLPGWCHIKIDFDGYEGWVDQKMITLLTEWKYLQVQKSNFAVTTDIFSIIPQSKEQNLMLVAGSTLPLWRPYLKQFTIDKSTFPMNGNISYGRIVDKRKIIITQALKYFNAPYLWGGRSPMGIDCSGFTQIIYKMAGVRLLRDASQQVRQGAALSFVEESQPGDLAFFDDNEGNVAHVGILWERNKIIHASGKVRIDNIDQYGIISVDTKRYTHDLRVIKRLF